MKAYVLLAALTLAMPADSLAGKRHHGGGGSRCGPVYYSGSRCYTGHYGGYYGGYRSSSYCYRPSYSYYRPSYSYGYSPYYYSSYIPAVSFSYTSAPRYSRSYDYGNGSSLEVDVQRALKRRGYYRGGLDGDIGPASRSAIRAYQSEHGLAVNGRIDSTLLRSLGI